MRILPSSRRRAVARLVDRQLDTDPTITRRVATIVAAVRQSGDAALLRYARKFDQLSGPVEVTQEEIEE